MSNRLGFSTAQRDPEPTPRPSGGGERRSKLGFPLGRGKGWVRWGRFITSRLPVSDLPCAHEPSWTNSCCICNRNLSKRFGKLAARFRTVLLLVAGCAGLLNAQESGDWRVTKRAGVRFSAVDVMIDTRGHPLAAYQLTFSVRKGDVKIVSIEGGEHPAFKEPPYYDPKAIQNERVVLAAFNTSKNLPQGKTRVATVHVQITGAKEPKYAVKLETAADRDGQNIPVEIKVEERKAK